MLIWMNLQKIHTRTPKGKRTMTQPKENTEQAHMNIEIWREELTISDPVDPMGPDICMLWWNYQKRLFIRLEDEYEIVPGDCDDEQVYEIRKVNNEKE